jgi:hypothetical protein
MIRLLEILVKKPHHKLKPKKSTWPRKEIKNNYNLIGGVRQANAIVQHKGDT